MSAEPIIGFRAWQSYRGLLWPAGNCAPLYEDRSEVWAQPWPRNPQRAGCDVMGGPLYAMMMGWKHCSGGANLDCECGWYGFWCLEQFQKFDKHPANFDEAKYSRESEKWVLVAGAMVSWGRLAIHSGGFRAEYARPVALLRRDPYTDAPAKHYGIPVVDTEGELVAVAQEHGRLYSPEGVTA